MDHIIREAKLEDALGLATVHVKTWQYAYAGQMPSDFLASLSIARRANQWENWLTNLQPRSKILVAEGAGKIIGFCNLGKSRDEDADETTGELFAIYIDPDYIGQGIGSALMRDGLAFLAAAGFKNAILWVLDTNEKTIRFYENKGWQADGKAKTEAIGSFEIRELRYAIDL
jgi:ribosomal protein S18 acetylase RimI-like enzyme